MITSGHLRHSIILEKPTAVVADSGQVTNTWATEYTFWGSIEPLAGRELFEAREVMAEVTHKVITRYTSSYTFSSDKRLNFGGRIFEIGSAYKVYERNFEVEMLCKEFK